MKIEGESQMYLSGVSEWATSLSEMSCEDFLKSLQSLTSWPFQRLDDLSSISKVLDRIDELLTQGISSKGYPLLELLLEKSLILLHSSISKSLYNSVDQLLAILDFSEWSLVYKALQIIHLLVNRITPVVKATKAHSSPELNSKLYAIGLGSNLNCSSPVCLQELCGTSKIKQLDFQYVKGEEVITSCLNIPDDLHYVWLNRLRMNNAIRIPGQREVMVACQLLALSCLMQIPPETQSLQDFCRSLPELWLLPAVSELLRMHVSPQVHIQAIHLLAAILVMMEGQTGRHEHSQNHLISSTHNLLATWQQHGLMQSLLRDISTSPTILAENTCRNNEFIEALLHLASIVADYKYRVDSSHVPGMTCSLLMLLENSKGLTAGNKSKAVRILSVVVSHSIDMFKEIGGLDTVLNLLTKELTCCTDNKDPSHAYLLRALLRLLKIVITKWDPSHSLSNSETTHILFESGLLNAMKIAYSVCYYDIYEPSLQLLCCFINFYKQLVNDLIENGTIYALLQSLEGKLPNNAKLVGVLAKFLCFIVMNSEGNRLIAGFSTIERLFQALGSTSGVPLTNDLAESIGDNLQVLMSNVPSMLSKAVDGCIQLLISIQMSPVIYKEAFFPQLCNIGKLIITLLNFSPDFVNDFISRGGFTAYLEIFKMPVELLSYNNEFHGFTSVVKAINSNSTGCVLMVVLEAVNKHMDMVETMVGPLEMISDFSHISDTKALIQLLTTTDSYIDIVRHLIANGNTTMMNIEILCSFLTRLSHFMKILISEQARISKFSHSADRITTTFNQPIDIHDIENVSLKSFEENFYFTCQLTIRKLYRFTTRITCARGRQAITEDSGVEMSRTMGGILAYLIKLIHLQSADQSQAYYFCLQLSDILKILLQDQNSNSATILTFSQAGGTAHVYEFLLELKEISKSLNDSKEKPYDLVNSLQILWNLCGKFLESLAMGKFGSTTSGNLVLKRLGCENVKDVNKKMQLTALEYITGLNYLECGVYSTAFARSVLEILKTFSNFGRNTVDSEVVDTLVDMGFTEQMAIQAVRATNSNDIDRIMDYLNSPKDCAQSITEEPALIENLHCILINSLPAIPVLKASVAEILLKICAKANAPIREIAAMLLLQVEDLVGKLLRKDLIMGLNESVTLKLLAVDANFEQLGACFHILWVLSNKFEEILTYISGQNFTSYSISLIESFNDAFRPEDLRCLSPLFSLLDTLCKHSSETDTRLMIALCNLINTHKNISYSEKPDFNSLVQILTTLTLNPKHAKIFCDSKALNIILTLKLTENDGKQKNYLSAFGVLLKQLIEDPYLLQATMEINIIQAFKPDTELKDFIKQLAPQANRSKEIFKLAFENVCTVIKKNNRLIVELKNERKEITSEKWNSINDICISFSEVFEGEQNGQEFMISSHQLVLILADIFQCYPVLINDVIDLRVRQSKKFLAFLMRNIIPFRYCLQLIDGKVVFSYPDKKSVVSPEVYQDWIKVTSKLIKSLTFKQILKQQNPMITEICNTVYLDNNLPILKARKRIFKELKHMLSEQSKKQWFGNEKAMAIIRSALIIIMQLLKEPPKPLFASNNSAEIARTLVSDQLNLIKHLSKLARGVKINSKKAGSLLNLILSPLDLLIKYNINFALHPSKPQADSEPIIEEHIEEDLENKFEIYEEDDEFEGENRSISSSQDVPEEENDELDEMDEDSDSEEALELEQDINEDEDDEDLLEESDHIEENNENIVIQGRNTEAFWAEDIEQESDPAENVWNNARANDEFMVERHIIDNRFVTENEEPEAVWPGYREINSNAVRWDRVETDEPQIINLLRDIESTDTDLWQIVMRRNRIQIEVPDRTPQKARAEDNANLEDLIDSLSNNPCESQAMEVEQEDKSIDPVFLAALPEDIRNELIRKSASDDNEMLDEEFFDEMPQEMLSARMKMNAEMDNPTFIASLTPDLRREVLMTANEEFLASLTPELVAEARVLQERVSRRQGRHGRPATVKPEDDGKVISEIVADDKLTGCLASVEDSFIEMLIRGIYLLNPINRDILASLLLNLSAQATVRGKILDALLCLLMQFAVIKEFPPQRLYGSETFIENYSQVYAIVAGRILDLLLHLAQNNPKISSEMFIPSKSRLPLIRAIRHNEEVKGFTSLLMLTQHKLFESSSSHLNPLINLISCILEKQGSDIPALDDSEILQICNLLSYESLCDISVKAVVDLVTRLAQHVDNKLNIEKTLYLSFTTLGQEISSNLKRLETSADGQKELQLLRVYKVFRGISSESGGLECVWGPLTEALSTITQRDSDFASTANPTLSKLLPVIETFFLSHIGASTNDYFQKFCDRNRKMLNILVKQNPLLLQDTFNTLVTEFPALLDFENKRAYFRSEIRKLRPDRNFDSIRLQVRRADVFMDSYHQLKVRTPSEMHGKLRVTFVDEDGVDAGGLTREWYELLAREMFNPNYALFVLSANGVSFQPNSMSSINVEHLEFFKFIGRIIGKALCDSFALDIYFTRSFYKHILGQEVTYNDMEDLDPDFFKNLKSLMDINLNESELHEYYFAYEEEEFGILQLKELEPGGMNKRVTEENKMEYIKLLCHMKMTQNISAQTSSFLEGFHELVPKPMISIFDSKELELLISGLPEFDVEDLKNNTEYYNYTKDSPVVQWLWEVLSEFSPEERAEFLQFVTGSSKVPFEGFKALPGMAGVQKFQIHKSFTGPDRLPTAHTCMNQLDLPEYPSKEVLRNRVKLAITEGKEGFGFM